MIYFMGPIFGAFSEVQYNLSCGVSVSLSDFFEFLILRIAILIFLGDEQNFSSLNFQNLKWFKFL